MECCGLFFTVRLHLVWSGRGPKWSNMPKFHKGDPVRSSGKQNRCQAIYVARNFLVAFLLKYFSPGEIWGWRKVKQMQPMWLCLFSCIQFEETYENAHQRKVIQMQPMWPCFFSYKQFEGTTENPNWRKVKQMQPMWQCLLWSKLFEDTFENPLWRKVKQMQPMWLCFFSERRFEDTYEKTWMKLHNLFTHSCRGRGSSGNARKKTFFSCGAVL